MNRKDFYDKLRKWEAEGYDVSDVREKWFPPKKKKNGSRIITWLPVLVVIFIIVAGIVIWQAMQPSPYNIPEVQMPSSLLSKTQTSTSTPPLSPAPVTTTIPPQAAVVRYALSTSCNPAGTGDISPSSGSYNSGAKIELTAVPSSGWRFDRWNGTDDNSVNPTTITMNSNKNITVYFIAQDTDGDGLTDDEERQIGTNPSYIDTDHDGLNDYQEVKVKKTDPLSPDTDGDGVKDGNDLFPINDAYVQISIKYFQDTSATGQGPDLGGLGDPYFIIRVGSLQQMSLKPIGESITSRDNPFSATFNVPDDQQYVLITVEVWDYDGGWSGDEQYDCGSTPGTSPDALIYKKQFNILGATITETSDGAADGSLDGPQANIIVEIKTVPRP